MIEEKTKKARILIVDDEPANLALLSMLMMDQGHSYETAINGAEGLEKVLSFNPDIILLDLIMPGMNGLEVCKTIKKDLKTRHIWVIFMTGQSDGDTKFKCLQAGANDFLAKPVDHAELAVKINNTLKLREIEEFRIRNQVLIETKNSLEEKNKELERACTELKDAQAQILHQRADSRSLRTLIRAWRAPSISSGMN